MNRYFKVWAMFAFAILLGSTSLSAQGDVEDALSEKSKISGLHFGSYVGFGYANGWQLEFSPGVGYRVFDFLIAEAGIAYSYVEQFDIRVRNDKASFSAIGPRVGLKGLVYQQFYGLAEFQYQTFKTKYKDANGNKTTLERSNSNSFLLGAGYTNNFGEGFNVYSDIAFDVLFDRNTSARSTPYIFRFGFFYTFP